MSTDNAYESPLVTRYAGQEMIELFGPRRRVETWRQLWIELAKGEQALGLAIDDAQIEALEQALPRIDWPRVAELEAELRHDVMAHIRAFGEAAAEFNPSAGGIIHLGATSCFVTDNADLLLYRQGLRLIARGVAATLQALADFARRWRDTPCLGYTHYQVAQFVTVGKRATLWAQDFLCDLAELTRLASEMPMRGIKGATGTQASFMQLFDGDSKKVLALDAHLTQAFGFDKSWAVGGQTYPRKLDSRIIDVLRGVAESAAKMANDIRLLSGVGELAEPRTSSQVGSSAMPYKRNPMRSERIGSLARLLLSLSTSPPATAATQWLERTLDDSANRRIVMPQAFLTADAILRLTGNIARGLEVREVVTARRVELMMPFLATENIMMAATAAGGDRQELHEALRVHSFAAWERVERGQPNDLLERIKGDAAFEAAWPLLEQLIRPEQYVGRAPEQVDAFLEGELAAALEAYSDLAQWETGLAV